MNQRRPFTFIAAIVLLGIGAVIAALIVAVIPTVQTEWRAVACTSNLSQIGLATIYYAADNHNYLPVWEEAHLSPLRYGTHAMTAANYWDQNSFPNYAPPVKSPAGSGGFATAKDCGANLFLLHIDGYLGRWNLQGLPTISTVSRAAADPSYFPLRFCPGQHEFISTIASQWGSSYFYNPHWIQVDARHWANVLAKNPSAAKLAVTTPPMTIWYTKLNDYPPGCALASDMIADYQSVPHPVDENTAEWNLLFPDGHVALVRDTYVTSALSATGDPALGDDQGMTGDTPAQMTILDDYLNILETKAAGEDPLKTSFLGAMISNSVTPLKNREVDYKKGKAVDRY